MASLVRSALQEESVELMLELETYNTPVGLLDNHVKSAGFTNTNALCKVSVTKQLTIELESQRAALLLHRMICNSRQCDGTASFIYNTRERLLTPRIPARTYKPCITDFNQVGYIFFTPFKLPA